MCVCDVQVIPANDMIMFEVFDENRLVSLIHSACIVFLFFLSFFILFYLFCFFFVVVFNNFFFFLRGMMR